MTERYLPKWAQEQMQEKNRIIRTLQTKVTELEKMLFGGGGSMFKIPQDGDTKDLPLPKSVKHMTIELPNGFEIDVYPGSSGNGGIGTDQTIQLQVLSHHGINIFPQSSNTIHIGPRRF